MKWLISIMISLLFASSAFAADKYVAKTGSNANPGTLGSPYLTIAYCLGQISQTGGDTCNVRTGTYDEYLYYTNSTAPHGTSFSSAVTIKNYNSEVVTLKASGHEVIIGLDSFPYPNHFSFYWILSGLIFDGTGGTSSAAGGLNADYIRVTNCEMTNTQGNAISTGGDYWEVLNLNQHDAGKTTDTTHGVYYNGNHGIFDGGSYHDNTGYGLQIYLDGGDPHDNIVRNVRIYNNYLGHLRSPQHGGGGLEFGMGWNNLAYNNLIYNNFGNAVDIDYHCGNYGLNDPCQALNNTLYGNEGDITIGANNPYVFNAIIKNNILSVGGTIVDNGNSSVKTNNTSLDPSFTDPANADFTIPFSSVARNNGADLTSQCTGVYITLCSDIVAKARPSGAAWDVGAYQYAAGTPPNLCGVSVNTGFQSQTLSVTITGCSTNFVNGTSIGSVSGTGVTVNSTTVSNSTALVLSLTISSTATLSSRDITITTGAETATGTGVFTVMLSTARKITVHSFTR